MSQDVVNKDKCCGTCTKADDYQLGRFWCHKFNCFMMPDHEICDYYVGHRDVAPVWIKSNPEQDKVFWDGEKFLIAVMVSDNNKQTSRYEYYVIRASCDSETPVSFVYDDSDEPFDVWDWEDVDWYISINYKDVAGKE